MPPASRAVKSPPVSTKGAADLTAQRFRRVVASGARGGVRPADLVRVRLTWVEWFAADLKRTLLTQRAVELRGTIAAQRYLAMARRRLRAEKDVRMNVMTNPLTDSIFVWLERR
jgi:hypothetical protein